MAPGWSAIENASTSTRSGVRQREDGLMNVDRPAATALIPPPHALCSASRYVFSPATALIRMGKGNCQNRVQARRMAVSRD